MPTSTKKSDRGEPDISEVQFQTATHTMRKVLQLGDDMPFSMTCVVLLTPGGHVLTECIGDDRVTAFAPTILADFARKLALELQSRSREQH